MKKVLLYPRVSSDEQAEKGYSLRDQEEKLTRYCHQNGKIMFGTFSEDFSAWKGNVTMGSRRFDDKRIPPFFRHYVLADSPKP